MANEWLDRMVNVVFPALLDGFCILTGKGELHPGPGVQKTDGRRQESLDAERLKPMGLPAWHVYLGAKPNQPAIRFLQFIFRTVNPVGSATLVYPAGNRDGKLGHPIIVPLGEGLETPSYELDVSRGLRDLILFKPVKIIALGRVRFFTTTSPWSLTESILMEVFSEVGEKIWSNPYIGVSLEEALEKLRSGEQFHSPYLWGALDRKVITKRQVEVDKTFIESINHGLTDEDLKNSVARKLGIDIKVVSHLLQDFKNRREPSADLVAVIRYYAEQFAPYYQGDEFHQAVADASVTELGVVKRVLLRA